MKELKNVKLLGNHKVGQYSRGSRSQELGDFGLSNPGGLPGRGEP